MQRLTFYIGLVLKRDHIVFSLCILHDFPILKTNFLFLLIRSMMLALGKVKFQIKATLQLEITSGLTKSTMILMMILILMVTMIVWKPVQNIVTMRMCLKQERGSLSMTGKDQIAQFFVYWNSLLKLTTAVTINNFVLLSAHIKPYLSVCIEDQKIFCCCLIDSFITAVY